MGWSKMAEERIELTSNADWILYKESDGSVIAKSRKDGTIHQLSPEYLKQIKSLVALLDGSRVKIE